MPCSLHLHMYTIFTQQITLVKEYSKKKRQLIDETEDNITPSKQTRIPNIRGCHSIETHLELDRDVCTPREYTSS